MSKEHHYPLRTLILLVALIFSIVGINYDSIGQGFKVAGVGGGGKTKISTETVSTPTTISESSPLLSVTPFSASSIGTGVKDSAAPDSRIRYTYAFGVLSSTTDGVKQYHVQDYLGTTRATTSLSGTQSSSLDVLPFGETLRDGAISSGGSRYGYTGKEIDSSSGLHYYGARYMDSLSGRFVSVDPIADEVRTPYHYTYDNPLRLVDHDGRFVSLITLQRLVIQQQHEGDKDNSGEARDALSSFNERAEKKGMIVTFIRGDRTAGRTKEEVLSASMRRTSYMLGLPSLMPWNKFFGGFDNALKHESTTVRSSGPSDGKEAIASIEEGLEPAGDPDGRSVRLLYFYAHGGEKGIALSAETDTEGQTQINRLTQEDLKNAEVTQGYDLCIVNSCAITDDFAAELSAKMGGAPVVYWSGTSVISSNLAPGPYGSYHGYHLNVIQAERRPQTEIAASK
ncbi:MAG: RHS repeat-associated core domain-containing protein [Nanoarchaeota archaeon]